MIKCEIIHNKTILKNLKDIVSEENLGGFTSLIVEEGMGPLSGSYHMDFMNEEHYYSFLVLNDLKEYDRIKELLEKRCPQESYFLFATKVEKRG